MLLDGYCLKVQQGVALERTNLEIVTIISSIILTIITAVYVVLTKRLLDAARSANEQNRYLAQENQRLQLYPQMFCHAELKADEVFLCIQNLGSSAAVDVDILAVGQYFDEENPLDQFLLEYAAEDRVRNLSLAPTDEGFYGVSSRFVYASFPPRRQVTALLQFPVCPESLYILLQFRDVLGNNYFRVYWMFINGDDERYRIGAIDPQTAQPCPKISLESDSNRLAVEKGLPLPIQIQSSHFASAWEHSLPAGFLVGWTREVEDAGEWLDV